MGTLCHVVEPPLIARLPQGKQMTNTLSDFSDVAWEAVHNIGFLEAVVKADEITATPAQSVDEARGLFRLPRSLVDDVIDFTENYAAACLSTRRELPSMPIPDPWEARRHDFTAASIRGCIDNIARIAERKWSFDRQTAMAGCRAATSELLGDLARRWEAGKRAYYQAVQGDTTTIKSCDKKPDTRRAKVVEKRRGSRGKTTDERLEELANSEEGLRKAFARPTIDGVAALIDRSHGAVAGSPVWKKKIQPHLEALKTMAAATRRAQDDERHHRKSDRRRK